MYNRACITICKINLVTHFLTRFSKHVTSLLIAASGIFLCTIQYYEYYYGYDKPTSILLRVTNIVVILGIRAPRRTIGIVVHNVIESVS